MTANVGVTLPIAGATLAGHRPILGRLREAGYRSVWTGEVNGHDGIASLLLFAGWEPDLELSSAVTSVYTRGPALQAMAAATLADAAPGRCRFGIGAGSNVIVERWNGIAFERPYRRVADTLRFLRSALHGGAPPGDLETVRSDGFRLAAPPAVPPKIVLGALGPRMQRLAAAEADGAVLNFLAASDVAQVRAAAGGVDRRVEAPFELSARVFVVPGAGGQAELAARRHIAGYLTVPVYAQFQRWLGRAPELEGMWSAWQQGERKAAVAAIPDRVVDELVVSGTPAACAEGVAAYLDAGLDAVTVLLLPPLDAPADPEAHVAFLCDMAGHLP